MKHLTAVAALGRAREEILSAMDEIEDELELEQDYEALAEVLNEIEGKLYILMAGWSYE